MRARFLTPLVLAAVVVAAPALAAPHKGTVVKPVAKVVATPKPAPSAEPLVTGLVIDTRGLNYEPRMSPRLFDDSAHNLLEGMTFDPDKVTSDGFARWVRVYNPGEDNPRIGKRPMVLKPIRVEGGDRLIFSGEDAAKLNVADAKDKFIERMRILIVY